MMIADQSKGPALKENGSVLINGAVQEPKDEMGSHPISMDCLHDITGSNALAIESSKG